MSPSTSEKLPYTVYFSIGDKNLKMTVLAGSESEASLRVRDKLTIRGVVQEPVEKAEDVNSITALFDTVQEWMEDVVTTIKRKVNA